MASINRYRKSRRKLPPGVTEAGGVFAGTGLTVGRAKPTPATVRARARGSFERRVAVLENIADGRAKTRVIKKTPKGDIEEVHDVSPMERLKAMALLAKYGGLDRELERSEAQDVVEEAAAAQALAAALADPAVRQLLLKQRPDLLAALVIPEVEAEAIHVEESGSRDHDGPPYPALNAGEVGTGEAFVDQVEEAEGEVLVD